MLFYIQSMVNRDRQPHRRSVAIAAPSAIAWNFDQTTESATGRSSRANVPKPQSRTRYHAFATDYIGPVAQHRAISFGCSTKFEVESMTPGMNTL